MCDYRDSFMRKAYAESTFYCPYSMYRFQCPFINEYNRKIEEYPTQLHPNQPKNPPPNYTPSLSKVAPLKVPEVQLRIIAPCIFKYTYLWLKDGDSFWSYIQYIGRRAIHGWKYTGGQWVHFRAALKDIKNFVCTPQQ